MSEHSFSCTKKRYNSTVCCLFFCVKCQYTILYFRPFSASLYLFDFFCFVRLHVRIFSIRIFQSVSIMLREINGRFHRTFMFYDFVWSTRLNFTSARHLNDWQLYLSYLNHWMVVHGNSELVGYPVGLIPVTSVIPTRFGEYTVKAFKRIQVCGAL